MFPRLNSLPVSANRRNSFIICMIAAFCFAGTGFLRVAAQSPNTWNQLSTGTYNWNNSLNWTNTAGFPNGTNHVANLDVDLTGDVTINLGQDITLGRLIIGDTVASSGVLGKYTISAGNTIFFSNTADSTLVKTTAGTDTIDALVDLNDRLIANITAGNLILSGGLNIGGADPEESLEKTGGGTLSIRGNLNVAADASGTLGDPANVFFMAGGTMNVQGASNTIARNAKVESGTLNFGFATSASSTAFTPGQGSLVMNSGVGGTVNFGVSTTAPNINSDVSIDIDRITIALGTLNLRNSTYGTGGSGSTGTTTLNFGSTGTLTLDGGTTTMARTDGNGLGAVVFPANAKLVMNNSAVFNFTDNVNNNASTNATTTSGSAVVSMTNTGGINVGDPVTGTNIPANARVIAINPGVSITLSHNATASGSISNLSVRNNTNLASLTSTSNSTILRSSAGNGILTVGGDGVADVFNGSLNLSTADTTSPRLVKIGAEDLTLGGTVDNTSARLEVLGGNAILAKASSASVHALGGGLVIGEPDTGADAGVEKVTIAGTYIGTGSSMNVSSYRDQLFRGLAVNVNSGALLDLNGNFEGFNVLSGSGSVGSSVPGGILLLGENNTASTFAGTLVDGGGKLSFWKGGFAETVLTGNNTYTGETLVGRSSLILSGANGALSGTSDIYVTRFSALRLDNHASNNNNRINNTANIILDQGELRFVRRDDNAVNTTEVAGDLTVRGSSIIRMDHTNVGGGTTRSNILTLALDSYNRDQGGTLMLFDQAGSKFAVTSPQTQQSRVTLATLPGASLLAGTTSASDANAPDTKILVGAFGGTGGGFVNEFMTVQTSGGIHYITPLAPGDYNSSITGTQNTTNIPVVAGAGTFDDNMRTNGGITLNARQAYNSWRQSNNTGSTSLTTIAEGVSLHLGGLAATPGCNPAFDGSGMLYLTGNQAITVQGGMLDFGNREAIIRADAGNVNTATSAGNATLTNNSTTVTGVNSDGMGVGDRVIGNNIPGGAEIVQIIEGGAGNSDTIILNVPAQLSGAITNLLVFANFRIDSRISGNVGLTKNGGNTLELTSASTYTGITNVTDGDLRIFDDNALGAGGGGNGTRVNAGRTLTLTSGIDVADESLDLLGNSVIQVIDRNNSWGGNILINPTDAAGQNVNMTFRTQGNAVLTVNGTVTTPGTNRALGYYDINPTYNGEQESQQFILENYGGVGGIMNFNGAISDRLGASAAGGANHDELNIVIRGYTGQPVTTNSDFAVNLANVSAVNGRLDLRSGFVNIASDFAGNNPISTRGAIIRLTDGGNVDRANSVAALMMSTPGTVFRGGQINVGENSGSYSSKSTAVIGGLNDSGKITFGTDSGSLDMNPISGTSTLNSTNSTRVNSTLTIGSSTPLISSTSSTSTSSGVNTITMSSVAGLIPGQAISGTGIPANTTISSIAGNVVTLSQNTNALAPSGTTYTYGTASGSTVITMSSVTGLAVGQGITGPGIAANTRITSITGNNVTLSVATNAAVTGVANYTYHISPLSDTNTASGATVIKLSSVSNINVGDGISGAGIPAGTRISFVDTMSNEVHLTKATTAAANATTVYNIYDATQTSIPVPNTAGLRVGMGISGTGVPAGATITSITPGALPTDPGTVTISIPLNNFAGSNTGYAVPLPAVLYATANRPIVAGQPNSAGQNQLQLFSVTGLSVGTLVSNNGANTQIPAGTRITAIDPLNDIVTLSNNLGGNVQNTLAINFQKTSNFSESRLYAAAGGIVDFQMRAIDDPGFGLQNEVGAISKVGRGVVELSGSAAGPGDVDGGVNLFGGTLIFDYDQGNRNSSRVNGIANNTGGNADYENSVSASPIQLTLAGGNLLLRDDESRNTVESMRGTLTIRSGQSNIITQGANSSLITLHLGYQNLNNLGNDPNDNWREPSRFAGGTMQVHYDESTGGSGRVFYSQNPPQAHTPTNDGGLGIGAIIPYATVRSIEAGIPGSENHVDFATIVPAANPNTNITVSYSFVNLAEHGGGNLYDPNAALGSNYSMDLSQWATHVQGDISNGNFGYMSDAATSGFTNVLTANQGSDFVGARVVRINADVATNTLTIAPAARLVLGTNGATPTVNSNLNIGAATRDGGAILVNNYVSRTNANSDQFITGGSLTSATGSTYFSQSVLQPVLTNAAAPASTSTDLIIHNYGDNLGSATPNAGAVLHIQSQIVDYNVGTPLNLVVSGPGTTHVNPTGAANSYTGHTYINDGTLWVSDGSRLGTTGSIILNGGTLEFAADTRVGRATTAISPTLSSSRPIILGGEGGTIKPTASGTTLTYAGQIRSEDNIIPLRLAEHNPAENPGVGDLIKSGAGRLILTNDLAVGASGWNAYYGTTEINQGTLQLNITATNSGVLGSNYADIDRTIIRAGGVLELQMNSTSASTAEWLELDGGTLGTTASHVDGSLNGVIKVKSDSQITISNGNLRLNADAGFLTGPGAIFKNGPGTLYLNENSPDFGGDWMVQEGRIVGRSQGLPFGFGGVAELGSTAATGGVAEIFLESRTTGAVFNTEYRFVQNILVNSEASGVQTKRIGARDFDDSISAGQQFDKYTYEGLITLGDELLLTYSDNRNNAGIPATGADRIIALNGGIVAGAGNLRTEIIYAGGHVAGADKDLRITYELNGDSSPWTGDLFVGNASSDEDMRHVVRLGNGNALKSDNDVTMSFNNVVQAGGMTVTAGNLFVTPASILAGTGAGAAANDIIVENAASGLGRLTFTQTVNEQWDALFRDGATPVNYVEHDCSRDGSLSVEKAGLARAVLTQNNTYSGTTLVSAGVLQVGNGGTSEVSSPNTGAGQVGNGLGQTGLGGTTVSPGAMISGTGLVNGLLNAGYSSITSTNGSNTLVFSNPSNLSVGQTILSTALTGGSGVITAINGHAVQVSSLANISSASVTATATTNHEIDGILSPGDGHLLAASTAAAPANSSTITLNNVQGLSAGMRVYGSGIAAGTTISGVSGNVITLSTNTSSSAASGSNYSFASSGSGSIGALTLSGNVDVSQGQMLLQLAASTGNYATPLDLMVGGANYNAALNSIAATFGTANPASGNHDHLQIYGELTIGSNSLVSVVDAGASYAVGNVFNLLDWTSLLSTGFDTGGAVRNGGLIGDLELPTLTGTLAWDTSKFLSDGLVVIVTVPEPSRLLLVAIGMIAAVLRRRRVRSI